jgi:FkbH-like protein
MCSEIEPFNTFNTPRVSQLSQRSNQFNLRTIRYSEAGIKSISESTTHESFTFTLKDKFGENGLICVIILEKKSDEDLFIDTWFMSCRVLKRGMENFVLNQIVTFAKKYNFKNVIGEYIKTPKNELVINHYSDLGFKKNGDKWFVDVKSYQNKKTFIKIINNG